MPIRSSARSIAISVLAGALPVAAAAQLMLAPAPASAATTSAASVRAGQRVQAPAVARGSLRLKGRQSAQLTLASVGAGVQVKITAGDSNCTSDETNKTLTTGSGPVEETISFDARGSGSCFFERSYSDFKISVTGTNTAGFQYDSSTRVFFGQPDFAVNAYRVSCYPVVGVRMSCRETGPQSLSLAAEPSGNPSVGALRLTTPRSTQMTLLRVGQGAQVKIEGGGATSNCTNDETNVSFTAGGGPIVQALGYDSKGSGSCFFERSYSFFKITVKGTDKAGVQYDSSANVFFGQEYVSANYYVASCEPRYLHNMSCSEVGDDRLELSAQPLR